MNTNVSFIVYLYFLIRRALVPFFCIPFLSFLLKSDDDAIHLTDPSQFGYTSEVDVFIPEMADIFIYQSYIPGNSKSYFN